MKYVVYRVMQHILKPAEDGGLGYTESQIILSGISMGTGPATMLASEYPDVKGLYLQAPYTSIRDVAKNVLRRVGLVCAIVFILYMLIWDRKFDSMFNYICLIFLFRLDLIGNLMAHHFNSLENMKNVKCPVLIMHGEADPLVNVKQGRALADQARKNGCNVNFVALDGVKHGVPWEK